MDGSAGIVLARLVGYLATAVLFGTPLFLIYTRGLPASPNSRPGWPWGAVLGAAGLTAASTAAWVLLQTAAMSGDARAMRDPGAVWSLLSETPFGVAAAVRLSASVLAALVLLGRSRPAWTIVCGLGAITVASLAWTGHGAAEEGALGTLHLTADGLHLLAAAAWIGALFGLAALIWTSARSSAEAEVRAAETALAGFSGVGTALVALLLLTGVVNGWFLVGPNRLPALFTTAYGRLLTVKLLAFGAMLCLAAANRFVLTPRLKSSRPTTAAVRALRASVLIETTLALAVLVAVSWLGTLMPPSSS